MKRFYIDVKFILRKWPHLYNLSQNYGVYYNFLFVEKHNPFHLPPTRAVLDEFPANSLIISELTDTDLDEENTKST